ncbi:hypothetical protein ACLOJK_032493 [Asimina triloba]
MDGRIGSELDGRSISASYAMVSMLSLFNARRSRDELGQEKKRRHFPIFAVIGKHEPHGDSSSLLPAMEVTARELLLLLQAESSCLIAASVRIQEAVSLSPTKSAPLRSHARMSYALMSRTQFSSSNSDGRACPMIEPM